MATTIRHYNGKQKRVHFTTGKMGDELNRKTDSEYNIIKMSYESMHPDAAIMSFEEHVRLADEAGNQQNPAQGKPLPSHASITIVNISTNVSSH